MPLILIVIGFVLIIYNYRGIKKENKVEKKEDILNISFQSILQDNKEELNDYKIEIGLLRRDMAESLTELQEEIVDIRNNFNRLKNNKEIYDNKENLEIEYFLNEDDIDSNIKNDSVISEIDFSENVDSNKTQNIKKLLKEGLTVEQICHELSVSKGEVLLVKGLYKN